MSDATYFHGIPCQLPTLRNSVSRQGLVADEAIAVLLRRGPVAIKRELKEIVSEAHGMAV